MKCKIHGTELIEITLYNKAGCSFQHGIDRDLFCPKCQTVEVQNLLENPVKIGEVRGLTALSSRGSLLQFNQIEQLDGQYNGLFLRALKKEINKRLKYVDEDSECENNPIGLRFTDVLNDNILKGN